MKNLFYLSLVGLFIFYFISDKPDSTKEFEWLKGTWIMKKKAAEP